MLHLVRKPDAQHPRNFDYRRAHIAYRFLSSAGVGIVSKIPSLPYASCLLFLLCTFNVPSHAGAPVVGPGIDQIALRSRYAWAALDFVSNQVEKPQEKSLRPLRPFGLALRFAQGQAQGKLRDEKKKTRPAWLGFDKVLHFSFSAGLVGISYHGGRVVLEKDQQTSRWMAGVGTGVLGIWKEWRDQYVSIGDLVADALGIATGIVLFAGW